MALAEFEDLVEINPGYRGIADLATKLRAVCDIEDEQTSEAEDIDNE